MDIEVYEYSGGYRLIRDAKGIKFSTHYGENGSGFGYLRFHVERPIGYRYSDIGFMYRVVMRHGLKVIYDGQIREITESANQDVSTIEVSAVGWAVVAEDAQEVLRAFADARVSEWRVPSQIDAGQFKPSKFNTSSNSGGLILSATTQAVSVNDYTELQYSFFQDEVFERINCTILLSMGNGVAFDAEVDSIDAGNNYIYYINDAGESRLDVGMTLVNITQGVSVAISAVDTGSNRITAGSSISSWISSDELVVYGPLFYGTVSNISGQDIVYSETYGENNIANTQLLINMSKKDIVVVSSVDTGTDTITVTGDVDGWSVGDNIQINAQLFRATVSSEVAGVITYSGDIGERIVSNDTGWVLYNHTRDEVATVSSWNTGASQVTVATAAEVSAWTGGDIIVIYTPFAVSIIDDNNNTVWPSDWRDGAVANSSIAVSENTTLSPTKAKIRFKAYLAGTGGESSFAKIASPIVYSTEDSVTMETIAKWSLSVLSTLGIDSTEEYVSSITKSVEPSVHDLRSHKDMLSETAMYGDQSGNRVAWGVKLSDERVFFAESFPSGTGYLIRKYESKSEISATADVEETAQRMRGAYTNALGERQFTEWRTDEDAYFGSYYLSRTVQLQNVDNDTDAVDLIDRQLSELSRPGIASQYKIGPGSIFDILGNKIPFQEVHANGKYIEVEDFRSSITGNVASDLAANWVRDRLIAVEVDISGNNVTLTPGKARKSFEKYMAELARIARI